MNHDDDLMQVVCALCRQPMKRVSGEGCKACERDGEEGSLGHFRCDNPACILITGVKGRTTACMRVKRVRVEA